MHMHYCSHQRGFQHAFLLLFAQGGGGWVGTPCENNSRCCFPKFLETHSVQDLNGLTCFRNF